MNMGATKSALAPEQRIKEFYIERKIYAPFKPTVKKQLLERWSGIFVERVQDLVEVRIMRNEVARKTSKDALLQIGFQLGDLSQQQNPFLFASTFRTFADRKQFLESLLETILNNPFTSEKNNPDTSENLKP